MKEKEDRKRILAKRVKIPIDSRRCNKYFKNERLKYGVCGQDCWSMDWSLNKIIANGIYRYIADAKYFIVENPEYWDKLEQCADDIMAYSNFSDNLISDFKEEEKEYDRLYKKYKSSMKLLTDNIRGLWW
jgi:hypothetical protein